MPTYLRQKGTGQLYIYSTQMAKRTDMEVIEAGDLSAVGEAKPAKVDVKIEAAATVEAEVPKKKRNTKTTEAPKATGADSITDLFGSNG